MELLVMVGLSGSGKSTYVENFKRLCEVMQTNVTVVSSDALRLEMFGDENDQTHNEEVFKELRKRIKDNIKTSNVVVDATNLTIKSRRSILNTVRDIEDCVKSACILTTSIEKCKEQNKMRNRQVPEWVIEKQARQFEIPFYEEGFDNIKFMGVMNEVETTVPKDSWMTDEDVIFSKMCGFDQRNPHHIHTLDKHCELASVKYFNDTKRLADSADNWENDIEQFPHELTMWRAAMIHDYGKLFVGEPKDDNSGVYRYLGHHNYGTYRLLEDLSLIGFNDLDVILECLFYINYHMLPFFVNSEKSENKWVGIMGKNKFEALKHFNQCDIYASGTRNKEEENE